jgi:hypothetical protein
MGASTMGGVGETSAELRFSRETFTINHRITFLSSEFIKSLRIFGDLGGLGQSLALFLE